MRVVDRMKERAATGARMDMTTSSQGNALQSRFGILYFCDDNPHYRRMLAYSMASLRRFHPDWPVTVIDVPSPPVPLWKHLCRALSFWKWQKRRERAGQDVRVIARKARCMLDSPYETTLYLDVDTIVLRPLEAFRQQAETCDLVITPLPWKQYARRADWQPEHWPYVMAGVCFYNRRFLDVYQHYVDRFGSTIADLPSQEQFVLSLACHEAADQLRIRYDPMLQLDVLNLDHHLATSEYPRCGDAIDLSAESLQDFAVFHYNHHKDDYMAQIAQMQKSWPAVPRPMHD